MLLEQPVLGNGDGALPSVAVCLGFHVVRTQAWEFMMQQQQYVDLVDTQYEVFAGQLRRFVEGVDSFCGYERHTTLGISERTLGRRLGSARDGLLRRPPVLAPDQWTRSIRLVLQAATLGEPATVRAVRRLDAGLHTIVTEALHTDRGPQLGLPRRDDEVLERCLTEITSRKTELGVWAKRYRVPYTHQDLEGTLRRRATEIFQDQPNALQNVHEFIHTQLRWLVDQAETGQQVIEKGKLLDSNGRPALKARIAPHHREDGASAGAEQALRCGPAILDAQNPAALLCTIAGNKARSDANQDEGRRRRDLKEGRRQPTGSWSLEDDYEERLEHFVRLTLKLQEIVRDSKAPTGYSKQIRSTFLASSLDQIRQAAWLVEDWTSDNTDKKRPATAGRRGRALNHPSLSRRREEKKEGQHFTRDAPPDHMVARLLYCLMHQNAPDDYPRTTISRDETAMTRVVRLVQLIMPPDGLHDETLSA